MAKPMNDNPTPNKKREPADDRVNFRVNASIKQQLESRAEAHHMSLSEYLIACALEKKLPSIRVTAERQIFIKALGELGKIGSNLNQLARSANQGQTLEQRALADTLKAVQLCADELRFSLTGYKPSNDNAW